MRFAFPAFWLRVCADAEATWQLRKYEGNTIRVALQRLRDEVR
jgi:hypothetical protein